MTESIITKTFTKMYSNEALTLDELLDTIEAVLNKIYPEKKFDRDYTRELISIFGDILVPTFFNYIKDNHTQLGFNYMLVTKDNVILKVIIYA